MRMCLVCAGSTVAGHYNNMEDKGLSERNQSRILHMRNFNNWIKSYLINKHMGDVRASVPPDTRIVAIDLGCGKGGDLFKWTKVGLYLAVMNTCWQPCNTQVILYNILMIAINSHRLGYRLGVFFCLLIIRESRAP